MNRLPFISLHVLEWVAYYAGQCGGAMVDFEVPDESGTMLFDEED